MSLNGEFDSYSGDQRNYLENQIRILPARYYLVLQANPSASGDQFGSTGSVTIRGISYYIVQAFASLTGIGNLTGEQRNSMENQNITC